MDDSLATPITRSAFTASTGPETPGDRVLSRWRTVMHRPAALTTRLPGWFLHLLAGTVLIQLAVYAARPAVTYKALELAAQPWELGLIASSFAALSLVMAIPAGRWVDRIGETPVIALGAALVAAACVGIALMRHAWAVAVAHALLGFGHLLNTVALQTMLANRSEPGAHGARVGSYTVAVSVGQLVGPALAGWLMAHAGGTWAVFAVSATIGLVTALQWCGDPGMHRRRGGTAPAQAGDAVTRPAKGTPVREDPVRAGVLDVLRSPGVAAAMLTSLAVLSSIDVLVAYLPVWGEERGFPVTFVALLLSVRGAASLLSRLVMGWLTRTVPMHTLLAGSALAAAAALAAMPWVGWPLALVGLMAVAGLGLGLGQPLTMAWVASRAPRHIRGLALGLRLSGNRLGQLLVPALVGMVLHLAGIDAIFWSVATLLLLGGLVALRTPF
ncbi:MFS transporter [Thermaerobacter sp. FW80]|uniref:MFS transporter n=1 Tax=Thermaerobacter sp. FW80 TaxID=2546351 RepID=UPI001074DD51|nr:MFS transporter [Thermaerobacter sp. FW80]QBS36681.1 MFS transporter [Thermaerobacter sp. FW80]